jgi:peptidoglycan/LPS O-acetylase OafA/YrhL
MAIEFHKNSLDSDIKKYREEIDGLRAIAVLLVIIFHTRAFSLDNGFIGVDIFFVISGYLINSIVIMKGEKSHWNTWQYLSRRVFRIVPALISTLFISFVFAYLLLPQGDLFRFAKDVIASLSFTSNIIFADSFDYFSTPAEFNALIHTWSLSIEAQLYLLLGALGIFYKRNRHVFLVSIATLSSLIYFLIGDLESNYYSILSRSWEFLLGSLVAYIRIFNKPINNNYIESFLISIVLIFIFLLFSLSDDHQKYMILSAAFITAVILLFVTEESWLYRILTLRILVFIGLISYSLYLLHQPAIVFLRNWSVPEPSKIDYAALIILIFILSIISYLLVERPFFKQRVLKKSHLLIWSLPIMILISFSNLTLVEHGFPQRYPPTLKEVQNVEKYKSQYNLECNSIVSAKYEYLNTLVTGNKCIIGNKNIPPSIVLWGDSHIGMYTFSIDKLLKEKNLSALVLEAGACPPIPNIRRKAINKGCFSFNQTVHQLIIEDPYLKTVMIGGRFSLYLYGRYNNGEGGIERGPKMDIVLNNIDTITEDQSKLILDQLSKSLNEIISTGKKMVLFYPTPEVGYIVPSALKKVLLRDEKLSHSYLSYHIRQRSIINTLDSVDGEILRIYPDSVLCSDDIGRCGVMIEDKIMYHDDNHLTIFATEKILGKYKEQLNKYFH